MNDWVRTIGGAVVVGLLVIFGHILLHRWNLS